MIYHKLSYFKANPLEIKDYNGIVCDGCGSTFDRERYRIKNSILRKKPKAFCTPECYVKAVSKTVEVECHQCSKEMSIKPAILKRSRRHFCSRGCQYKYRTKISIASELLKILDFDIAL